MFIFNYVLQSFKAYCAIWVRRSNFRHQASPRVSPRESTRRRKVELWTRNVRKFCLNADSHVTFRDLYFPSEGRRVEDFFALKIRRLRPGANPRTWVPKASTLPLDHRSCLIWEWLWLIYWSRPERCRVGMKARHSDRRTAPSDTIGLHPTTIPSLIPIYEPGSEGVEPCQNPNDGGRVGWFETPHPSVSFRRCCCLLGCLTVLCLVHGY